MFPLNFNSLFRKSNGELTTLGKKFEQLTSIFDNTKVNGAVNMLPNNVTTQTINGITFTVNDDGSIIVDGTATSNAELSLNTSGLKEGKYRLSGCPSGGSLDTYTLFAKGSSSNYYRDFGDGVFIINDKITYVRITIKKNVTVSNLTFKPMITVPTYNGDYVPYAKSNKELTENVEELSTNATKLVGISSVTSIFDVLSDRSLYPSSNAYWATAAKLTNGNNTLSSLLNINDNSIVRIDVYSEWYIGIKINDASHGNVLIAWASKTTTQLNFIKINTSTSPYVSQVTVSKAI